MEDLEKFARDGNACECVMQFIAKYQSAYDLNAVKQDGLAVKFVKDQTEEICREAVNENGMALQYVKDQTDEICIHTVGQDGMALQYVREPTADICKAALLNNPEAVKFVGSSMLRQLLIR